ncbi:MAG TPA: PaaI family thioesterase [Thermoanaerobaculia bacterium]|nr:PaaI family thioesterase [Thermoanaerobaculia bacterium]
MSVEDVRESFSKQHFMTLIGASLEHVGEGEVVIALPFRGDLVQQTGTIHAGVIAAIADSACGYAALTKMPAGANVLSVEFKINLLAPAAGTRFVARARVIRAGRTLTTTAADVFADETIVATMLATMIRR